MCIIAIKPAGIEMPVDYIKNMWSNNDDGAGFMYADRGKVRVVKGLMTLEDFIKAYDRVGAHRKVVMHFRIKTHGAVSPSLTHPFWIKKGDLAMVHNGIITGVGHSNCETESDTSLYAKQLAHRYADPLDALTSPEEHKLIASEIGWSKLVFLTGSDEHIIVNEQSGSWDDGMWFSNGSYKSSYARFKWTGYHNIGGSYTNYPSPRYNREWEEYEETTRPTLSLPASTGNSVRTTAHADEQEWEALLARYEAQYGSCD